MENKYCTACGCHLPEGSLFCPNCGRQVNRIYAQESSWASNVSTQPAQKAGKKKGVVIAVIAAAAVLVAVVLVVAIAVLPRKSFNSNYSLEPCFYCDSTPSVAYKLSSGEDFYVCTECSSICMYCEENEATHYGENLIGTRIIFVCDECYD